VKDLQPLMTGYICLTEMLKQHGFTTDNKPFKPHLTLARIRNEFRGSQIASMTDRYQDTEFGLVIINRIVLFESISSEGGPVYKPLFVKNLSEK
jgi:2'-5' RNA ligase